jgi:prepilin-type processing-associated H-X9-DG protein
MQIPFTCPHCGNHTQVDEKYAGTSGPCRSCGKTITVPGAAGPGPRTASGDSGAATAGISVAVIVIAVVAVPVVLAIVGILVALLLPAINAAREAARRNQCTNQLKHISVALRNYENVHKTFPPAYIADENGNPMHSWRVLILPYLEERALYEQYDFDEPWDSPTNRLVAMQMPATYRCPSGRGSEANETNYMLITGPQTAFQADQAPRTKDYRDGLSQTILVAEGNKTVGWTEPVDLDASKMTFTVNGGPEDIGSDHSGGMANVAFADGHVSALSEHTDPEIVRAMCTPSGGEVPQAW